MRTADPLSAARPSPGGLAAGTRGGARHYFMCPPTYFDVRYCINPWMDPACPVDPARALAQWQRLHDTLGELGHHIELVEPHPASPDMVFAANGGILVGDRGLVPRFRFAERANESTYFRTALRAAGVPCVRTARFVNEGEGDFRLVGGLLLAGVGPRSEPRAAVEAGHFFELPVLCLTLVDPRLYHLDTALAVLDDRTIAYWPPAFDAASQDRLAELYPDAVIASEPDAAALALNLVSDGTTVVLAPGHSRLTGQLGERGFDVIALATDELRKAGGGAKCCVLEWHARPTGR